MPHDFPGTMHRAKKCPCCTSFLRVALLCQILNKTCQNIQTQQELELAQHCTNLYLSLSRSLSIAFRPSLSQPTGPTSSWGKLHKSSQIDVTQLRVKQCLTNVATKTWDEIGKTLKSCIEPPS